MIEINRYITSGMNCEVCTSEEVEELEAEYFKAMKLVNELSDENKKLREMIAEYQCEVVD